MTLCKDDQGKLVGCGDKDKKAYARFLRLLNNAEAGEIFTLDYWFPRHGKFHRLHFKMLTLLFDAQEQFQRPEHLRAWLQVGAGHVVWVPGPNGKPVAIPDSISYERLDDEEFHEHHERVKDFVRSANAQHFLWPHIAPHEAAEIVAGILDSFERDDG